MTNETHDGGGGPHRPTQERRVGVDPAVAAFIASKQDEFNAFKKVRTFFFDSELG